MHRAASGCYQMPQTSYSRYVSWSVSQRRSLTGRLVKTAKLRCYHPRVPPQRDAIEDEFDILDEIEGRAPKTTPNRPKWLPEDMEPVLEELPKWSLLVEVLEEIEREIANMGGSASLTMKLHVAFHSSRLLARI